MSRINQVQKLAGTITVVFLAGALTGCDNDTSKKLIEDTYDPITHSLGADNLSAQKVPESIEKK